MSLFEVGRLVVKIAGRDAGKTGIVVDSLDENSVLIDGQTRRKKCNIKHLEPLPQVIKIKKGASHTEVKAEFKKIGLEVLDAKPKESAERPKKQKKVKTTEESKREEKKAAVKETKEAKKETKKERTKEEEKTASSFEEKVKKESKE